jgi:hypothetical protein
MQTTFETPVVQAPAVQASTNTLLNDLLGALVSHISKAVVEQIQPQLKPAFDADQLHELIESYMSRRYDHFMDGHIERWMKNNFDISEYTDNIDLDYHIDNWMSNNFDISNYESDLEIQDKVTDAINNLTFEVRVS